MQERALEEKQLAIKEGNIEDELPYITVIVDGSWDKRSYGHRKYFDKNINSKCDYKIVVPCVSVKEESLKVADTLAKIDVNYENDADFEKVVSSEVRQMSNLMLQTYHQRIEFSANGVFLLDGTLIYSDSQTMQAMTSHSVSPISFFQRICLRPGHNFYPKSSLPLVEL
ncbi:hypothetical protein ILUMI_01938 [Ignelater luminosus]|uniref:Uncharacterized protein n=1 Tax=Ignelater luminosus TaxID=2038154 RepID=A0A8K0GJR7_IGNLU|nr:hypothetical protein ILUMI_01938 [Ignelater luminosus]